MDSRAKKPKLLLIITKSNWGGAQRYVYDLALEMSSKYEVVVALGGRGLLSKYLKNTSKVSGIKVYEVESLERDIGFGKEWRSFTTLIELIQKERPDVVHLNSSKAGFLGVLAARYARVPCIVFTAHGWAFNESRPLFQRLAFWMLYAVTVVLSHRVIAASAAIARQTPLRSLLSSKITIIHHGRRTDAALMPTPEARKRMEHLVKERLGRAPKGPYIGMVGELHPIKGHRYAIDAMKVVQEKYQEAVLVVVGDGELRESLEERIRTESLSNTVALVGHQADVDIWMRAFDLLLFPSLSEALGYVAIEAGIAGLPVIASSVGGIPEIIEHEKSGILVPAKKGRELADAIIALLSDSKKMKALGMALHERIMGEFTIEKMVAETEAVYRYKPPKNSRSASPRGTALR